MPRPTGLDVFHDEALVGSIQDTSPMSFEYSTAWLGSTAPFAVATIPLNPGRQDSIVVEAFFENLLPEGELRSYLAEQRKASTLFCLLLEIAGDSAGGFVILPAGQVPEPPSYEPTSWAELGARLKRKSAAAIDIQGRDTRISLAGVQDKAAIAIFDNNEPMLPRGTSPSTHILKPDIRRLEKVWASAVNEAIVMVTAARCGLPTAEAFYEPNTRSCIVKRFDRVLLAPRRVGRLIQYDLCQLSDTVSDRKYEAEGGPGAAACASLIRRFSSRPAVDLRSFVSWIFFNLFTGNNDGHAKNLAMYGTADKRVSLAPFYDLMCTRIYPGLSRDLAFSIGGEARPGSVKREHVGEMARQFGMRPAFFFKTAEDLATRLPSALDGAVATLWASLDPAGEKLAERLRRYVLSETRKAAARILA